MKFFKGFLFIFINILNILLGIATTVGACWFALPTLRITEIGTKITSAVPNSVIFWITIAAASLLLIFYLIKKYCFRRASAKVKNFFTHLNTWLMAFIAIAFSIVAFIYSNIEVQNFDLTKLRKSGIVVCFGLLFLSHLLAGKIAKVINRKIQSYENAKELNVVGRSSIIFTNILKLVEILFPEVIVLSLICFCVSWNVAAYFLIILVASLLPMLGNIECDFTTRKEIIRKKELEDAKFIENVANKIKGDR